MANCAFTLIFKSEMLLPKNTCIHYTSQMKILDKVGRTWSVFISGWFFQLPLIWITPRDHYKRTFIMNQGPFVWVVMLFGLKNEPPTYQKAMNKTFKDYLDDFMKLFLDDFIISSDSDIYLSKLRWWFKKCWEYGISLNSEKCAFMVFLRMILLFIISKEGKLLDSKKVEAIVEMPMPKNLHDIQVFNGLAQFYWCFVKKIAFIMAPIIKLMCKLE